MARLFDTHAHYDDEKFSEDRTQLLEEVTAPCPENPLGISFIVNCASDIASANASMGLAEKYPFFRAAVGIHPHEASGFDDTTLDKLRAMLKAPYVVAIGEIGLDYHYDFSPRDKQKCVFDAQLALSEETGYPVIVHDREAHGDISDMIAARHAHGIIHSFSGSGEMAKQLVKRGYYISYSGSLTFKNAHNLKESALLVPEERLLVETDSPYLSPFPYRGKRNDSRLMYSTLCELARIRNKSIEEMAEITYQNACRVFKIDINDIVN